MPRLLVIKLGGSVVTFKESRTPKARIEVIKQLAKEIKQIFDLKQYRVIIVHGTGSFGHPIAKKYKIEKSIQSFRQKLGFAWINQKIFQLNSTIVNSLLKNGIPAVSFSPRSFLSQEKGKLLNFNLKLIKSFLNQNFVPVLFGDMVFDSTWNGSILSSDTIVSFLARKLKADRIIFLSDVDGIYTSDPKENPNAKLIPEITNKNIKQVLKNLTPTGRDDVTREMYGKILEIQRNLTGIKVWIINGLETKSLTRILDQSQIGTRLMLY